MIMDGRVRYDEGRILSGGDGDRYDDVDHRPVPEYLRRDDHHRPQSQSWGLREYARTNYAIVPNVFYRRYRFCRWTYECNDSSAANSTAETASAQDTATQATR